MPLRILAKGLKRQAKRGQFRTPKKSVPNVAKSAQHPHSKLKTQKELKKITDSSSYKKADYKGKTGMLGGKVYAKGGRAKFRGGGRTNLLEELGRVEGERSNKNRRAEVSRIHGELNRGYKSGGRAKGPKNPHGTPRRKAGPSAPSRPRKRIKTHGGGPDSGNIGKLKDVLSKHRKMPTLPKLPDLSKLKKRMPKYMKPLKGGGSAKKPRPHGPHMWVRGDKRKRYAEGGSVGAAVRGRGCEIK